MQIGRVVFRLAPHIHSDTKPIHAVVQAQTHRSAANAERAT